MLMHHWSSRKRSWRCSQSYRPIDIIVSACLPLEFWILAIGFNRFYRLIPFAVLKPIFNSGTCMEYGSRYNVDSLNRIGTLYPPLETLKKMASSKIYKIQTTYPFDLRSIHILSLTNQLSDTASTMCRWRQSVSSLVDHNSADATL